MSVTAKTTSTPTNGGYANYNKSDLRVYNKSDLEVAFVGFSHLLAFGSSAFECLEMSFAASGAWGIELLVGCFAYVFGQRQTIDVLM